MKHSKHNFSPFEVLVMILALITAGVSGIYILSGLWGYHRAEVEYDNISSAYVTDNAPDADSSTDTVTEETSEQTTSDADAGEDTTEEPEPKKTTDPIYSQYTLSIDHAGLKKVNPDYVGWIYFSDGNVSYPIVQDREGTEKYLHCTFEGQKNADGAIFIDMDADPRFDDLNTITYGHNMKNTSMFGSLRYLYNDPSKLKSPYFFVDAADGGIHAYKVFAMVVTDQTSDLYRVPQNEAAYEEYTDEILKYPTAVYTDRKAEGLLDCQPIVTLSTCYGTNGTTRRLLIFGVRQKSSF